MDSIIFAMINKVIDVHCSLSLGFRGTVESVNNGVVKLKDDAGKVYYISSASITAVSEVTEPNLKPGFIG